MSKTLGEIAAIADGDLTGDPGLRIRAVSSIAAAGPDTITFAETDAAIDAATACRAAAVIVPRSCPERSDKPLIRCDSARLGFIKVATTLHPEPRPAPGVHGTAVVDPSARLGAGVSVGPHAVVGAGAEVGTDTVISAGVVIGDGVRIGAACRIYPRVVLYAGVRLGDRVRVHAGAVLGADGFGYVDGPDGKVKFPQLGELVIEDDVEIGANATLDRAALDATVVRRGTKIDNLVQVAHNVEIGAHCAISSQCGIAGTARLGDHVVLGGQSGVADHAVLEDGVILGARAGVPTGKKLVSGQIYWGTPARPIQEVKRRFADVGRIRRLIEQVKVLTHRLDAEEGAEPRPTSPEVEGGAGA